MKTIAIAADHGGILLKAFLLKEMAGEVAFTDFGPSTAESVDYPDFAAKACRAVQEGKCEKAILVCGSGIGMSIAANKMKGIRAAHTESLFTAELAGLHNNANVLCLGERVTGCNNALAMVRAWLKAEFEFRHQKRLDKLHSLEN